eukprot:8432500-Alexandrium_andersonii.AAC.1
MTTNALPPRGGSEGHVRPPTHRPLEAGKRRLRRLQPLETGVRQQRPRRNNSKPPKRSQLEGRRFELNETSPPTGWGPS